jgi:putative phage-type endonuclease
VEQGSGDWLTWRRGGLGSSDIPIIMGVSPWRTPHQLWQEKTKKIEAKQFSNFAIERGNRLEPKARAMFELLMDESFPPFVAEHPEFPQFRVSLDGWSEGLSAILEIKCPGEADHTKAKNGEVPEKYIWQVEW